MGKPVKRWRRGGAVERIVIGSCVINSSDMVNENI